MTDDELAAFLESERERHEPIIFVPSGDTGQNQTGELWERVRATERRVHALEWRSTAALSLVCALAAALGITELCLAIQSAR